MTEPDREITLLLEQWSSGDASALDRLFPLIYSEVHRLAAGALAREPNARTLQPTALVNEMYLRIAPQQSKQWHHRRHFLAVCAQVIRQVLVDNARSHNAQRRGAGLRPLQLDELEAVHAVAVDEELVRLDEALTELKRVDPFKAHLVELRYFGGFENAEIARIMDSSPATIKRHWTVAKTWLFRQMQRTAPPDSVGSTKSRTQA